MVRAEWITYRELTDEEGACIARAMSYAATCLVRDWDAEKARKGALDRMTRDGEHYLGDGPYGA